MARQFRVLNLFGCQGGSARGYELAGATDILGVDLDPQPRYPYQFVQSDALRFLDLYGPALADEFDFVDASPPCQRYSATQRIQGREHPDLIGPVRERLEALGLPYVIENVEDARPWLKNPVTLCGSSFGLHTYRHRLFEAGGWTLDQPPHPEHTRHTVKMGRPLRDGDWYHAVGNFSNVPYVKRDLGVEWMSRDGIRECVPPAYTAWIGRQFLAWRDGS